VKNSIFKSFAVALAFSCVVSAVALAQAPRGAAGARAVPGLSSSLPPSDAVALINVNRVLDEALPKLMAENPAKLAEVNDELARFKTQTGLDPRSFHQIALGLNYTHPSEGITKINTVAIANGTFNAGALVAAGRLAANGKYVERKYQGKTIYVFSLDRQVKLLGLWNIKVSDLAITSIDRNMLALGSLESVQGVIEANRTRKHANQQ